MPPSDAQKAVEEISKRLAALEVGASQEIIEAYRPVNENLRVRILQLTSLAQKRKLKPWQIMRITALTTLKTQLVGELALYHSIVQGIITSGQSGAVGLAETGSRLIVDQSLPRGLKIDNLARLGIQWNRLPREAFQSFVGIAGDGQPVGNLLARYGPQNAARITAQIGQGIATGKGPREVARLAQRVTGIPLSEALTISRTEINRSHREAKRLNYAANSDIVKGYRRLATKDALTCMACIALDGTAYETSEPLDSHPNCRCAMVPDTLTYQDLGLDIPDEARPESGEEWFKRQPEKRLPHHDKKQAIQSEMMGGRRLDAMKAGKIQLSDLVTVSSSSTWGKSATVKSVKALGV